MLTGKRIIVLGCPGSGKTTFAQRLHELTGLELYFLDRIWWRADRTHISREEFDRRLGEILARDKWIIDGDYSRTYEPRIRACDTVIFLDFSLRTCLNGISDRLGTQRPDMPWIDTEPDPELVKSVRNYRRKNRPVLRALLAQYPDKQQLYFKTRAQADRWLAELAAAKASE